MTFDKTPVRRSPTPDVSSRIRGRRGGFRAALLALAPLSLAACTAGEPLIGATQQAAVNPLPADLNLVLNARDSLNVGTLANVNGDAASSGAAGSVFFDISATQGGGYYYYRNLLGNSVHIQIGASVGRVYGNDILVEGTASAQLLGFDPAALPQVPAGTAAEPGRTKVDVASGHLKQLCAGQYGTISVGTDATLNLNGGVYHINKLTLADGARLEPSEPVVLLIGGNLSTGTGAVIRPFAGSRNPMSPDDIRIEVGRDATLGPDSDTRAHILVPAGLLSTGQGSKLYGAGWARDISIGVQGQVYGQDVFNTQPLELPAACNDNSPCTTDECVGGGTTTGFCRNTPIPAGTSCEDGVFCNGEEKCNATGQCQAGPARTAGTSCADGNACNGAETCNGYGSCVNGTPPVLSDGNGCTADSCDPETGVEHAPLPDGTTCYGSGTCEGGTCSIAGTTFSEDFYQYQSSPAQCSSWNAFRGNLSASSYSSITMSGTFAPLGVTCTDPTSATQICAALRAGTSLSVYCNGRTWSVGSCYYGGVALSAGGSPCSCSYPGYTARPCDGGYSWGGVNTYTCSGPSQNITVNCQ